MKWLAAALCAVAYVALFELNRLVFSVEHSWGVHYIFLPAGARLFAVLLLGVWGALGITLGSIYLVLQMGSPAGLAGVVLVGVISGFSPLLARDLAQRVLRIDTDPRRLSGASLFKLSLLFAVVSPLLHQLWFFGTGQSPQPVQAFAVMAVGDLAGTMIFLYAVKVIDSIVLRLGGLRRRS